MPIIFADFNQKFRDAAEKGFVDIIKTAIADKSFNINRAPASAKTALHLAVINGQIAVVRLLLKHPKIINSADKTGKMPFDYARELGNRPIMRILARRFESRIDAEASELSRFDLLHSGRDAGHFNAIKDKLCKKDVSTDEIMTIAKFFGPANEFMGFSLLFLVAQYTKNFHAISKLLECGYDPNRPVGLVQLLCFSNTPLHMYIANEDVNEGIEFIQVVQACGKSIDFTKRDDEGKTTLLLAAKIRRPDCVSKLLALGAGTAILIPDGEKRSILHIICALGDIDSFNQLKDRPEFEILINSVDSVGKKPLDMLDMSESDTRTLIESIYINPDRDLNAPKDDAPRASFKAAGKSFLNACMEGRRIIKESLSLESVVASAAAASAAAGAGESTAVASAGAGSVVSATSTSTKATSTATTAPKFK